MENKENMKAEDGKEISSRDLLCKNEPENIGDDLIIGFYSKYKGLRYSSYVRFKKEDQKWKKILELIGTHGFVSSSVVETLKYNKIIQGNPCDCI